MPRSKSPVFRTYSEERKLKRPFVYPTAIKRNVTVHRRRVAVLAVTERGFTLCTGSESISYDTKFSNSELLKEVSDQHVSLLYAADERTFRRWRDATRKTPAKVYRPFPMPYCSYCEQSDCHKWLATACASHLLRVDLDRMDCRPVL